MWKHNRHPLAKIPLLDGASNSVIERLGSYMTPVRLPAGRVLVTEGQRNVQFILIESGAVSVTRDGQPVAELRAGDFVGELSLLGDGVANATVTTTTPVDALVSSSLEFDALLRSTLGETIQATAAQRIA
jgi:CRP-like cAMP-binding protein